jgi:hypothetical protein
VCIYIYIYIYIYTYLLTYVRSWALPEKLPNIYIYTPVIILKLSSWMWQGTELCMPTASCWSLLGLFFSPENGGDILRNVRWLSTDYRALLRCKSQQLALSSPIRTSLMSMWSLFPAPPPVGCPDCRKLEMWLIYCMSLYCQGKGLHSEGRTCVKQMQIGAVQSLCHLM